MRSILSISFSHFLPPSLIICQRSMKVAVHSWDLTSTSLHVSYFTALLHKATNKLVLTCLVLLHSIVVYAFPSRRTWNCGLRTPLSRRLQWGCYVKTFDGKTQTPRPSVAKWNIYLVSQHSLRPSSQRRSRKHVMIASFFWMRYSISDIHMHTHFFV